MADDDLAIRARGLGKLYHLGEASDVFTLAEMLGRGLRRLAGGGGEGGPAKPGRRPFWALREVDFDLRRGEVLGVIGRNGSGKSTLLKILARITPPTTGEFSWRGHMASLLEVGTGFKQELSGWDNIFLSGALLGLSRADIRRRADEIVEFAEIGEFIHTPVKRYSSGMSVRLAFAVAAHLEPEILLLDEVLAVGDLRFQRKCLQKMGAVAGEGRTVVFVSHNMQAVSQLCHNALLLDKGRVAACGPVREVVQVYQQRSAEETRGAGAFAFERPAGARAWVRRVSPRGGDGERRHFDLAEPWSLEVEYAVEEDLPDVQVIVHVLTPDGLVLFSSRHLDPRNAAGEGVRAAPHGRGLYTAACRVPAPLLNMGFYEVRVVLGSADTESWFDLRRDMSVEITDLKGSFASSVTSSARRGFFAPVLEWEARRSGEV